MENLLEKLVDYKTVANMYFIEKKSVANVAEYFGITWEEAREAIRSYGFTVKKSEKAPEAKPTYKMVLENERVVRKEKVAKAEAAITNA